VVLENILVHFGGTQTNFCLFGDILLGKGWEPLLFGIGQYKKTQDMLFDS